MRPKRLEVEGFASFRERTAVDFEDAPLFVLSGPTGAGKSSLVDAITFALYGSVSRYEDRRLVAPVITQGQLEGRVRLDFSVQDATYTAVRVVRRTSSGGATTREARLEMGDDVVAGNESELSERVEKLLGLNFEHFTKCVVLPQGEFAQFLKDKPRDRQALLVKLLDIGIYGRMAKLARVHQQRSEELASLNSQRLEQDFSHATPEHRKLARQHLRVMERLLGRIEKAQPPLSRLSEKVQQNRSSVEATENSLVILKGLKVPEGMADLGDRLSSLSALEEKQRKQIEQLSGEIESVDAKMAELPDKLLLVRFQEARRELDQLTPRAQGEHLSCLRLKKIEEERAMVLDAEKRSLTQAQRECEQVRDAHAAAHLAARLKPGEACPVCSQPVSRPPEVETPGDLRDAESQLKAAAKAVQIAEENHRRAREELRVQTAKWEGTCARMKELEQQLKGVPSDQQLEGRLGEWTEYEESLARLREQEKSSRAEEKRLRRQRGDLEAAQSRAQADFLAARDALIGLKPPPLGELSDLTQVWEELREWSGAQIPILEQQLEELGCQIEELEAQERQLSDELQTACQQAELKLDGRPPLTLATEAVISARAEFQRIDEDLEKAKTLRSRVKALGRDSRLAKEMSALLGSRGFERWYLDHAMRQLVAGASLILNDLSSAQYSLALDDKGSDFLVVDHNNADERRLARTLSGGETFLASLSLALALSEHVAGLSAQGASRLEAIFLDEGFGTLDPDTLETVAGALDELGQKGRMVGLITHVPELAGRIPVRYQVSKDARGSHVVRIAQ